jgi:carbon monoxide dehydrogenase subunit G
MPTALERTYERSVRIEAPHDGVYEELDTAHGLARFIPQLDGPVLGPDDDHGACRASVSIGLLSYEFDSDITVRRATPPHSLEVELRAPSLRLELDGVFNLTVNARDETTLRYTATIRSTHPVFRRMSSALTGVLEEHVDSTTDLIAVRAHQYTRARRRLTETDPD